MKPIQVGDIEINDPVILAPMSGVTDLPFRQAVKSFGAGLLVSEMIASEAMIRASEKSLRMASSVAEEWPMSLQLAGCDPLKMAEAAKMNEDRGAAIIDINMGCPVKKVVNGHAGSALMRDLEHAAKLIHATVNAVSVPVTLKMRLGWDDNSFNAPELAKIAEQLGVKMITVHGRTRCQLYRGTANWQKVGEVKKAINLPLIVNGDIVDYDSAEQALAQSGADGIMVGRGCYGRPWLIENLMTYFRTGEKAGDPDLYSQYQAIMTHYDAMLDHYGDTGGLRIARKHLGWYSKGLRDSADFRNELNKIDNVPEAKEHIKRFYLPLCEEAVAA